MNLNEVKDKASNFGRDIKNKTQNTMDTIRYNSAISDEEKRIKIIKYNLADKYIELFKDNNPIDEMDEFIVKIKESEKRIEENKQLLSEIDSLKVHLKETKSAESVEVSKNSGVDNFAIILGILALIELLCWQYCGIKINTLFSETEIAFAQIFSAAGQFAYLIQGSSLIKLINYIFYMFVLTNILLCVYSAVFNKTFKYKRLIPAIIHFLVFLAVGIFMLYLNLEFSGYYNYSIGAYLILVSSLIGGIAGLYLHIKKI